MKKQAIELISKFLIEKKEKKIKIISVTDMEIVLASENGEKFILRGILNPTQEKEWHSLNNQFFLRRKSKKIQSKKGKIISANANIILAPALMTLALSIIMGFPKREESNYSIMPNMKIEMVDQSLTTSHSKLNRKAIASMPAKMPIVGEKIELESSVTIQETIVEVLQKKDMSKRLETDTLFGQSIDYYASRYGIPSAIGKSIITQERSNQIHENIGQLTRNICGEKFLIPIIEKNSNDLELGREMDKLYVVRDLPMEESFENSKDYQQALYTYQSQLKEAIELEQKGYQIFKYEEVIQNPNLCIQIAMANLSHCVYKCKGNVNQAIRAYNGGYGLSVTATDEEIANGLLEIGDPFYNAHVFSHLFEEELDNILWKIKKVNTLRDEELSNVDIITIKLQFNNVKEVNNEKENGYHI